MVISLTYGEGKEQGEHMDFPILSTQEEFNLSRTHKIQLRGRDIK